MSTLFREDLSLLDYYPLYDPTSPQSLSEQDDLDAVDLRHLARTSVRGIAAASQPLVTIFSGQDTECPSPRTDRYPDRQTGEIIERVHRFYSPYRREHIDAPCDRNRCRACGIRKARKIAGAIYVSRPSHVLTLTQVGDDYQAIRRRLARFFGALRRTYPTLRYLWTVESNPLATGNHAHAYIHLADEHISQTVVDRAASRTDVGSVDIASVPVTARATYMGYCMKDLVDSDRRDGFLTLNGTPGRQFLVHPSRGFYRDGRTGQTISRHQAETFALSRR